MLVLSYDTSSSATAVDSATVDAIYTAWGLSAPAAYAMTVPGAPAETGIDTVGAIIHVNYDGYTDKAHYDSDPFNVFGASTGLDRQFLDTIEAFPGLEKSIRHVWTYADTFDFCEIRDGTRIGREITLPDFDTEGYREAWFEVAVKVDTNSIGGAPSWVSCTIGNQFAWKIQQIQVTPGSGYGRWQTVAGNCGVTNTDELCWKSDQPYPEFNAPVGQGLVSDVNVDRNSNPPTSSWNDGEWHKMRYYIKMGSDSTISDGTFVVWQDTMQVLPGGDEDSLHQSPALPVAIKSFITGQNKDKGGWYATESDTFPWHEKLWIGYVTAWVAPDTPSWYKNEVSIPSWLEP